MTFMTLILTMSTYNNNNNKQTTKKAGPRRLALAQPQKFQKNLGLAKQHGAGFLRLR